MRKGYVMAVRLDNRQADFEARFETLLAAKREATVDVAEAVAGVIADVRARGGAAQNAVAPRGGGWPSLLPLSAASYLASSRRGAG